MRSARGSLYRLLHVSARKIGVIFCDFYEKCLYQEARPEKKILFGRGPLGFIL